MDMPSLGLWQVAQARPLVPRLWKNGPVSSIPPLIVLYVCDAPLEFGKNTPLGINETKGISCAFTAARTISMAAADAKPMHAARLGCLPRNCGNERAKLDCRTRKTSRTFMSTLPAASGWESAEATSIHFGWLEIPLLS